MSRIQQHIKQPQYKRKAAVRLRGRSYSIAEAGALAIKEHNLGNFQVAVDIYNVIRAKFPEYAEIQINRGVTLQAMKRYAEALASFDQAIALKPDHAEAHNNRGVLLQEMRQYDGALASFDKTIALKPDHAVAYHNRGIIMVIKGDMSAAERLFQKALELNPGFPAPWFNLVNNRKYQNVDNADVKSIYALLNRPGISLAGC